MSKPDYSKVVEEIFRVRPETTDEEVMDVLCLIRGKRPSRGTLAYWKTVCRKRGVDIPDRRRK